MHNPTEMTDDDREELLRLVLREADGEDVSAAIGNYPRSERSRFRRVAIEAKLVEGGVREGGEGEQVFGTARLSERGRRRLVEIERRRDQQ